MIAERVKEKLASNKQASVDRSRSTDASNFILSHTHKKGEKRKREEERTVAGEQEESSSKREEKTKKRKEGSEKKGEHKERKQKVKTGKFESNDDFISL